MTMRHVQCEFCLRLFDFQKMFRCPVCKRAICRFCKHDGPLEAGRCARRKPCTDEERTGDARDPWSQ